MLVLAAAGLDRLQRRGEAGALLHEGLFVPAAGQGVIAIQAREGSPAAARRCAPTMRAPTPRWTPSARRARARGHLPHPGRGAGRGGVVRGFVGLPDGSEWLVEEAPPVRPWPAALLRAGAVELLQALTP